MVKSVNNYNNGYVYKPRSQADAEVGFWLASAASGGIMATLPLFSKPFVNQMKKEHANNHNYKDIFYKALDVSELKEDGVIFKNTIPTPEDIGKKPSEIIHADIKAGLNACYIPNLREVRLNAEKASISGFHELGHAMNHLQGTFGKILQSARKPGYGLAGLMGYLAMFSRTKPKEEDKNLFDKLRDNCGKIAFLAIMPTVIEEGLASYKGVKLAEKSGLSNDLVKNLKKFYGKAWLSYFGYALATGVSVFVASKITEYFTRPKKIPVEEYYKQNSNY